MCLNVFGMIWLHPNPNGFDPSDMTADGNYTDNPNGWGWHVTITNTTVLPKDNVPPAAQAIIAHAGSEAAYKHLRSVTSQVLVP